MSVRKRVVKGCEMVANGGEMMRIGAKSRQLVNFVRGGVVCSFELEKDAVEMCL